jgi:hypothetical protein
MRIVTHSMRNRFTRYVRNFNTSLTTLQPAVFDGVLSPAVCTALTSPEVYDTGPDIYRRTEEPRSPQEVLIESLLRGLGMESTRGE